MSKPRRPPRPRPTTRPELLAREREVWSELSATWRGLPDEALVRQGACGPGWSVKDVMNHAADRDRPLAGSRRRLNRARRELLRLLDDVPDGPLLDPSSRVNSWVRNATYSHYGEHIWELSEFARQWKSVSRPPP